MSNLPLGEPGLGVDGAPARSYDQAPHTRRSFSYQDYAVYALLLKSIDGDPYVELWIEHHDDILAVRRDGRYDIYQVKIQEASNDTWMIGDGKIQEIIARFCVLHAKHGEKIAEYYIYSNIRPYVPAPNASIERQARSVKSVAHALEGSGQVDSRYSDAFQVLKRATGADEDVLRAVLSKLQFIAGPSLDTFRADWPTALGDARSQLKRWPIKDVMNLQLELIRLVHAASSAQVPPLSLHTSPISAGGLPLAEISLRRVSTSVIRRMVSERIHRRRISRVGLAALKIGFCLFVGGLVSRPLLQVGPLQHALDVIQHAQDGVQPAEFNESVAIVRAAHKPLAHLSLDGANIQCLDLSGLNMERASGLYVHATGTVFDNSILAGAFFRQGEFNGAKFRNTRMNQVFFQKSNMLVANLDSAEARNSNFSEATMTGANLSHGVFSGAKFNGSVFDSAEMQNADFINTDLKDAILTRANVSGANFTGARNLTQDMLSSACISDASKPPIVSKPLRPTTRLCFTTPKEQEEREIKRLALLAVGQLVISQGYCKDFQHVYRSEDSKLHPQDNERIWLGGGELGAASKDMRP